ncbi:hypothetical protein MKZ38_005195 [Zalerion maritima]|uniref:lytic cellulose monooxygenase (C4-dehydrogenating) n=1 Tax=Zalerion maritima TaxID=339359 RepID=A0AAD5WW95_9PEZI|nr:hypothetical protein MKZ38_005195 [Zalerion maritima]
MLANASMRPIPQYHYTLSLLSLLTSQASAHYIFQKTAVADPQYGVYEHIRKNTSRNSPVTDLSSGDLRCNEGDFTFTPDVAVYHQGPVSVFMSKAPESVHDCDGSGEWFKIHDVSPTFSGSSAS